MKFKLIEKSNPRDPEGPRKVYASAVNGGRMTLKVFAGEVAGRSSLTKGDIENVLRNSLEQLPLFLKMGMSVQFGDFGTFRLTLSSTGADSADEFTVRNIKGCRVVFTPGPDLKEALRKMQLEELKV